MSSAKWHLVSLHIWIVLFDYSFGLLTIPYIFFPELAYASLGLFNLIGVPMTAHAVARLVTVSCVIVSINSMFESRFHTLSLHPWKHIWTKWRPLWLALNYIFALVIAVLFISLIPEQEHAITKLLQKTSCIPPSIPKTQIFVVSETIFYPSALVGIFVALSLAHILFFISLLLQNVHLQLKSGKMSQKTFELHKKFFIALFIQVSIPFILMGAPLLVAAALVFTNFHHQSVTNFGVISISMHGFVSTIVMIVVHQPYRKAVTNCIAKRVAPTKMASQARVASHIRLD